MDCSLEGYEAVARLHAASYPSETGKRCGGHGYRLYTGSLEGRWLQVREALLTQECT